MPPTPPPLEQFLLALWPADDEGLRCVSTLSAEDQRAKALDSRHKAKTWRDSFFPSTAAAVAFASQEAKSSAVYVSAAVYAEGGRKKANARSVFALWADLDFGTEGHKQAKHTTEESAVEALDAFPLPPSAVIHTGGGLSAWWFLREPFDVAAEADRAAFESTNRALAAALKGDAVADAVHVMRAPGGFNFKHDPPRAVLLRKLDPENRFNLLMDFDFLSPLDASAEAPGGGAPLAARIEALPALSRSLVTLDLADFNATARRRGWHTYPSRSERDFAAVRSLIRQGGWSDAEIHEAFESCPVGERFRENGPNDLTRSISKIRKDSPSPSPPTTGTQEREGGDWTARLLMRKDNTIAKSIHNAIVILEDHPDWRGVLGFDAFAHRVTVRRRPPYRPAGSAVPAEGLPWTDDDETRTTAWLHQQQGLLLGLDTIHAAAIAAAKNHSWHPVRAYLDGLRWDGRPRAETWLSEYLGATETPYTRAVGSKWLISAVARVYQPGCQADHVLILEGPQGCGKSTALRNLAPAWFTDELDALGSKDAAAQLLGVWIVELAELEALSRSEIARTKAFLSKSFDRYRPPYARNVSRFDRGCVFAGSVNHADYLKDETGGRRFWPVTCAPGARGKLDTSGVEEQRDQLWAEAVTLYRAGSPWWLEGTLAEHAAREQEYRYHADPWESEISLFVQNVPSISVSEIFPKLGFLTSEKRGQRESNRIVAVLRRLRWTRRRVRGRGGLSYRYFPPSVVFPLSEPFPLHDRESGNTKAPDAN